MNKETQLTNWFTAEKPVFQAKKMIYFAITWFVILLLAFLIFKFSIIVKLILVAGIAVWGYFKYIHPYNKGMALYKSRPADAQVDQWFEEGLNNAINKVVKREGIDEDDEDELKAPTFISCHPHNGYHRYGFDGKERWAVWKIQMLFFKEDSILCYTGEYGHISESSSNEVTQRVFYKDIVSPKIRREEYGTRLELTGTDVAIDHYPGNFPVHGKNRTSDFEYITRALEKLMHSTKYKTVNG